MAAVIADRTRKVSDHGRVYALLAPAVERYTALYPNAQVEARDLLDRYIRAYAFLSQIVAFGDVGLEVLYLASRALILELPAEGGGGVLDLGTEVELTHLRLARTSEGAITPEHGGGDLRTYYDGKGPQAEPERERLSKIIDVLNDRFGLQLTMADQLFFDQLQETFLADEHLVAQARANPIENFRLVFNDAFMKGVVGRMDENAGLFRRILDDPQFQTVVMEHYLARVFQQARTDPAPAT